MFARALLLLLPIVSQCQVTLFRQSSHTSPLGLSSHHSHEVHDGTSSHSRHHTSTTGGLRVISQAPALVSHAVHRQPSLVQHRDGRFFAVNANLQAGQLIQSSDGRYFTLAGASIAPQFSVPISSPAPSAPAPAPAPVPQADSPIVEVARDVEQTTTEEPIATTALAPTEAPAAAAPRGAAPQEPRGVIATAPLTSATSRFVSALPLVPQLTRVAHPVTHVTHSAPVLSQPRLLPVQPAVTAAQHSLGFRVVSSNAEEAAARDQAPQQQLHIVRNVPAVAQEHQVHLLHDLPPVVAVGRGHQLADTRSNVFQGFFEFPSAGVNFEF